MLCIQTPASLAAKDSTLAWKQSILEYDLQTCQKPFTEMILFDLKCHQMPSKEKNAEQFFTLKIYVNSIT